MSVELRNSVRCDARHDSVLVWTFCESRELLQSCCKCEIDLNCFAFVSSLTKRRSRYTNLLYDITSSRANDALCGSLKGEDLGNRDFNFLKKVWFSRCSLERNETQQGALLTVNCQVILLGTFLNRFALINSHKSLIIVKRCVCDKHASEKDKRYD